MKIVPYVLAVLFLMGLLTLTSMRHTLIHQAGERAYVGALNAVRDERNNEQKVRFMASSEITAPPQPRHDKKQEKQPAEEDGEELDLHPNRWKWTIYDTLLDVNQLTVNHNNQRQGHIIMVDHATVFTRLLRILYSQEPWWEPGLEFEITSRLVSNMKEPISHPDNIASIKLGDPHYEELFYRMLKGSETTPALLDFLTADSPKSPQRINLFHAPEPLLAALFDDPDLAHQIVALRTEMIAEYENDHFATDSNKRKHELEGAMTKLLNAHGDKRARVAKIAEWTLKPQRSKYRYVTVVGTDPNTHIENKQRIRLNLE